MLLANYITSAWRNILRHKLFSFINILGLAIGLAAVMLIALYVRYEMSYDSFWKNADNIYRIHMASTIPGLDPAKFTQVGAPIIHILKREFPQIKNAARIHRETPTLIYNGNYMIEDIDLVDPEIVNIFDFKVISGSLKRALTNNNSLILNQSRALEHFGNTDPIGQIITVDFGFFKKDYVVSAIIEDIPKNSHLDITSMIVFNENEWSNYTPKFEALYAPFMHLYFSLKPGTSIKYINDQMPNVINRSFPPLLANSDSLKNSDTLIFNSLNIKDLHLKAEGVGEFRKRGDIQTIISFSLIAILILIIACINFMNLSTARAGRRAKEIGLRKLVGASRVKLIQQFIGESIFFSFSALLIALCFIELIFPYFNQIFGKNLYLDYSSYDLLSMFTLTLIVGVLSGFYPAFILSKFRPIETLKDINSVKNIISFELRSILVVTQFTASIILVSTTAVVYSQLSYIGNKELGFNKDNLLIIDGISKETIQPKLPFIVDELSRLNQISSVTTSSFAPGKTREIVDAIRTQEMTPDQTIAINSEGLSYDFFKTYNIPILAGREFDSNQNDIGATIENIRADNDHIGSIIINNSSLNILGYKNVAQALDEIVYMKVADNELERKYKIIGVVADSHFTDLKKPIPPTIYYLTPYQGTLLSISYKGDTQNIIQELNTFWKNEYPETPIKYNHVTDLISVQYDIEVDEMTIFAAFSALAIFIACLGLFGLASFTAERRTKEIGIRKVMGASIFDIVKLLVWQFSKPVIIANLIAWPLSFYAMSRWLESFVYRIDNIIIIAMCLVAGLAALLIAWATVAGNSYAVARANPIKALRYE